MPDNRALDMCADLGVKWIRVDFNWYAIEPAKGKFNWKATDRVVREAESRGLYIFGTLAYTPKWASGGKEIQHPALDPRDWYDFVYIIVSRYSGSVKHWGMWNEPNLPGFFSGTADDYVNKILKIGRDAVKAADPGGLVLGPDLSHRTKRKYRWDKWMKPILESGGGYIDIITHHIYKKSAQKLFRLLGGPTRPWELLPVTELITQSGCAGKPLWITETGWCAYDIGYEDQAELLTELLYLKEIHQWPDKIFIYQLFDDKYQRREFGILTSGLERKPAYTAYKYHIQRYWSSADSTAPGPEITGFPDYIIFEAETDPAHRQGRREKDGWACDPLLHRADYMCIGPEFRSLPGNTSAAVFRILVDDINKDNKDIVSIDIYDSDSGKILGAHKIERSEFKNPFRYQDFIITYSTPAGSRIMPRVFWDGNAYTRANRITITGGK